MARHWQIVSPEEAKQHPLYGIKNWLVVFAVGLLLGPVLELGLVGVEAEQAGMSLSDFLTIDHPAVTFVKLALILHALMAVVIFGFLVLKHPKFRFVSTLALLGLWPALALVGAANSFPGLANELAKSFFGSIASCAIWVTYLQRSKRVRVTFEHRILADKLPHPKAAVSTPQSSVDIAPSASAALPTRSGPLAHGAISPNISSAPVAKQTWSNESLWSQALAEFESNSRRSGLWAKSFAEAQGNELIAKAAYLRERVAQLEREHQEQVAELARQAKEQTRQAEERAKETALAHLSPQRRAYALLPKGLCPKCDAIILRSAEGCPKCGAIFDRNSAWKVIPLGADKLIDRLKSAYLGGKKPTPDEVIFLAGAAESEKSLVVLCDRFRGETLLHWCARFDLKEEATTLIASGANASAPNGDGRRPYELAENPELRRILHAAAQ